MRRPILMYHSTAEVTRDPQQLCVPPTTFARQMRTLAALGLRGVGVAELLAAERRGAARGLVGLTFDDGYADIVHGALPTLERHAFTATVFVLSGRPGGANEWDPEPRLDLLHPDQIVELRDRGMEIGSHGRLHRRLPTLDPDGLRDEVSGSRDELTALLRRTPAGFCYPYGAHDARVREAVATAGYTYACGVKVADPCTFALRRFFVGPADTPVRLSAKLALDRLGLYGRTAADATPAALTG